MFLLKRTFGITCAKNCINITYVYISYSYSGKTVGLYSGHGVLYMA